MVRAVARSLIAACAMLVGACDEPAPPAAVSAPSPAGEALVLAIHPYDTPSRLVARFEPLSRYLSETLGLPVELYVAVSYEDQIRKIAAGEVDLAFMGPTPYLRAHDRYAAPGAAPIIPIAGEEEYFSVVVVRRDSGIETVADLRGRTMAFGSHRSFSSHYMPRAILLKHGVGLGDLKDYAFLERHERVALAVLHGDYDAGGVNREIAAKYLDQDIGLKVVEVSPALPPHAIVARSGLDADLIESIRAALLRPDEATARALAEQGLPRFVAVSDAQFDFARRIVAALEKECRCVDLPF